MRVLPIVGAVALVCQAVLATDPGVITVVGDSPVPLTFSVPAGTPYKLHFPASRLRLWKSPEPYPGTELTSDAPHVAGQGIVGDANGDGQVRLDDLILIRNDRATQNPRSDITGAGGVDNQDIIAARMALGSSGGGPLTVYAEGLTASTALGDITVELWTDPDQDSTFTLAQSVTLTSVGLSVSPRYDLIAGSIVTVTMSPASAPLAFGPETTMAWEGQIYNDDTFPPVGPSEHVIISYSPEQVHEQSASQARFVIGDGTKASGRLAGRPLSGWMYGTATFNFGSLSVRKAVDLSIEAPWTFAQGGDNSVGDPVEALYLASPNAPEITDGGWDLESFGTYKYVLLMLVERNSLSEPLAPPAFPVDLVSYDADGRQTDRVTLWMYQSGRDDYPGYFTYCSHWNKPIMFIDSFADPSLHPTLTLVQVRAGGYLRLRAR